MMAMIFILLFVVVFLAWVGKRRPSIYLYFFTLFSAALLFVHHITSHLSLQL